jgi:uncharacterized phiE125 gp8 family phage protein
LREPFSDEDTNIERIYIPAARERVEVETGRQLMTATKTLTLDGFPRGGDPIYIPTPPLQSVSSVVYVASDGTETTMSTDDYVVDTRSEPGRIFPKWNSTWPSTRQRTESATVLVTFVCGYTAASLVPSRLREAILLLVGHYYRHREEVIVGVNASPLPRAAEDLMQSHIVGDEFVHYGGRC